MDVQNSSDRVVFHVASSVQLFCRRIIKLNVFYHIFDAPWKCKSIVVSGDAVVTVKIHSHLIAT